FCCQENIGEEASIPKTQVGETVKKELIKEFDQVLKENNLIKTKEVGELAFTISYLPHEYLALKEMGNQIDNEKLKKSMENYSELVYFQIQITNPQQQSELLKYNLSNADEYDARIKYYAFDADKDIKISQSEGTTACAISHFERNFDVVPHIRLLAAFEMNKLQLNEDIIFEFQDNVFNKGIIKVKFDPISQINLPNLEV
ncbi:MAG: hypothetical protein MRY83_25135, partial [Flavobacteriales bacterium]|nr:hypothetical protein [Flavobacteriales bacterium]